MELVFNEFSEHRPADDAPVGLARMQDLLKLCKEAQKVSFNKLAVRSDFFQTKLYGEYTIDDWLVDPNTKRDQQLLIRGFIRFPYVKKKDEAIEDKYIESEVILNEPEHEFNGRPVEGLAIAFFYQTIAISFNSHPVWGKDEISLFYTLNNSRSSVTVKHASAPEHIATHHKWLESIAEVVILESTLQHNQKPINLRDDKGKDELDKFAKKLRRSPFVEGIINSLPFNNREINFIRKVREGGLIEIVLTRTDQGLGLVVKTTGRNLRETKEIAERLKKEFESQY